MRIFALFPDSSALDAASDALDRNGFGDAIEHVRDANDGREPTRAGGPATGVGATTVITGGGHPTAQALASSLGEARLPDAVADMLETADDGARLITLELGDDAPLDTLARILEPHAARVIRA